MTEYLTYKPIKPTNRILGFTRRMRKKPTEHEAMVKFALHYIANNNPDIKEFLPVISNQFCFYSKVGRKWYIVDFYIQELRLVIEVDGNHHTTNKKQVSHDAKRTKFLESIGLSVERIPNRDVLAADFSNNLKKMLHKHIKKQVAEYYTVGTSWRNTGKIAKKIKKWKKWNKKTKNKRLTSHPKGIYLPYMEEFMKRISWHLTEQQLEALRRKSRETGLSVAELIRRSIDAYLKE